MKNLNLVFKLLVMAMVLTAVTACSGKKDGGSTGLRDRRTQGTGANGQPLVPGGPRANVVNQNCPNCGYIFSSADFRIPLIQFLLLDPANNDLGQISSAQGQNTGVFFRGQVSGQNGNSLQGRIEVVVWDSKADQSFPYVVSMDLSNSQSDLNTYARLTFSDSNGSLTLSGSFTPNGTYEGTVSFQNNGGPSQNLGNFVTGDCSFITAGCYNN